MDKPAAPRWSYSKDEKWKKGGTAARSPESSLLESNGAHLAETPPNCDVETWKQILGDDRTLRNQEKKQPEPKSPTNQEIRTKILAAPDALRRVNMTILLTGQWHEPT